MGFVAILFGVLKFILFSILFLLLLILLLLALPFSIKLKGSYADDQFDFDYSLHYAWILPLNPIINKFMGSDKEEDVKPSQIPKETEPPRRVETTSVEEPQHIEEVVTTYKKEEQFTLKDTEALPDEKETSKPDDTPQEATTSKESKRDFLSAENKALAKKIWQSKDLIIQALIAFLKLFHFKPLRLEGNFGLDDPADTAFLFASIYASLPLLPFLQFKLNPYYIESKTDIQISFRSTFSILQILLAFVYNFYLRRLLFLAYRTYQEWNQKELETAF